MKRLKVRFVDPETRCKIEDLGNIIIDWDKEYLIAHYIVDFGKYKEVEIQVIKE